MSDTIRVHIDLDTEVRDIAGVHLRYPVKVCTGQDIEVYPDERLAIALRCMCQHAPSTVYGRGWPKYPGAGTTPRPRRA